MIKLDARYFETGNGNGITIEWMKYSAKSPLNHIEEAGIYQDSKETIFYIKDRYLHRENGAAVIYKNGNKKYYLHGREYKFKDYYNFFKDSPEITNIIAERLGTEKDLT